MLKTFVIHLDKCVVNYKLSKYRDSNFEKTLDWNDPHINIKWPINSPIISKKDRYNTINFKDYFK